MFLRFMVKMSLYATTNSTSEPKSGVSRFSEKVAGSNPTMTLVVSAVISLLVSLSSYYTLMPLFGAPAMTTGANPTQVQPSQSNGWTGLYTWVDGTAPAETNSFLNFGSGALLLIALFLTIFGTASVAAMVIKNQMDSLVVAVFISGLLGYVYGIFTKVAVDNNMTWFVVWTVAIVLAAVLVAALSAWKFFKAKPDDSYFTNERKNLFWFSAAVTAIGAILLIVEHYHMGSKMNALSS